MKYARSLLLAFVASSLAMTGCLGQNATARMEEPSLDTGGARDQELLAMAADSETVATGKTTYAAYCAACHGAEGLNVDSPSNLFDQKWYHESSPSGIEAMVNQGVLEKGMPPWAQMISKNEIESVVAYLISFQTTTHSQNE